MEVYALLRRVAFDTHPVKKIRIAAIAFIHYSLRKLKFRYFLYERLQKNTKMMQDLATGISWFRVRTGFCRIVPCPSYSNNESYVTLLSRAGKGVYTFFSSF